MGGSRAARPGAARALARPTTAQEAKGANGRAEAARQKHAFETARPAARAFRGRGDRPLRTNSYCSSRSAERRFAGGGPASRATCGRQVQTALRAHLYCRSLDAAIRIQSPHGGGLVERQGWAWRGPEGLRPLRGQCATAANGSKANHAVEAGIGGGICKVADLGCCRRSGSRGFRFKTRPRAHRVIATDCSAPSAAPR